MLLLPIDHLTLLTELNTVEVRHRLSYYVNEPEKVFKTKPSKVKGVFDKTKNKEYEGGIYGNTFRFGRIINYHNSSFLIVIEGQIFTEVFGSKVVVTMKLHEAVMLLMVFFLSTIGAVGLLLLFRLLQSPLMTVLTHNTMELITALLLIGTCIFLYGLILIAFSREAKNYRIFLRNLFRSKKLSAQNSNDQWL